jgi:hypothetical protein
LECKSACWQEYQRSAEEKDKARNSNHDVDEVCCEILCAVLDTNLFVTILNLGELWKCSVVEWVMCYVLLGSVRYQPITNAEKMAGGAVSSKQARCENADGFALSIPARLKGIFRTNRNFGHYFLA